MERKVVEIYAANREPLIVGNSTFLSSNDYVLRKEDLDKAYHELEETVSRRISALQQLKEKLKKDKIKYRIDDNYLLRFLRVKKYDCNKAYTNIKEFYNTRKKYPELFTLTNNLESVLNVNFFSYLPYTDDDGAVIFILRFGNWDPGEISFTELLNAVCCVCDIIAMNPHCQVNGCKGIWDTKGLSVNHCTQLIRLTMYLVPLLQNSYPWRVNRIMIINCNLLTQTIYKCVRPLIKKKISERVKFLGSDFSELHQHVNPKILPKEFGGALEETNYGITQHILDNMKYLEYERSFGEKSED